MNLNFLMLKFINKVDLKLYWPSIISGILIGWLILLLTSFIIMIFFGILIDKLDINTSSDIINFIVRLLIPVLISLSAGIYLGIRCAKVVYKYLKKKSRLLVFSILIILFFLVVFFFPRLFTYTEFE